MLDIKRIGNKINEKTIFLKDLINFKTQILNDENDTNHFNKLYIYFLDKNYLDKNLQETTTSTNINKNKSKAIFIKAEILSKINWNFKHNFYCV